MKKQVMGLVAAMGLMAVPAGAVEFKPATVDTARVLKEYYKTDLAERHMKEQIADFSAERDKLLDEHKKLKQDFEALRAESQSKALTEAARDKKKEQAEEKLNALVECENSIQKKAAGRKRELEGEGRKIQAELGKAINEAIRSCAQKGGYTMVFATGGVLNNGLEAVLYSDSKMDITDEVLKILNADKPVVKE